MTYQGYLNKLVDEFYKKATKDRVTWQELAKKAGLSYATVYRLGMRITKYPQLRTVFALAKALNVQLPAIVLSRKLRKVA